MTNETPTRVAETTQEVSALLDCSANVYNRYFSNVIGARSPYDLINANAVLAADLFEIGGLACAAMLQRESRSPLQ